MELITLFVVLYCNTYKSADSYLVPKLPSTNKEVYTLDDVEYTLVKKTVNWYEAEVSCLGYKYFNFLAVIDTEKKINFFLAVLQDLDVSVNSLWIGWDKPNSTFLGDQEINNCKSLAKSTKLNKTIQYRDCSEMKPFLCQQKSKTYKDDINWTLSSDKKYAVLRIKEKVTWKRAVINCIYKYNSQLLDFGLLTDSELGYVLPEMNFTDEAIWVGEYYKYGQWRYLSSGKIAANRVEKCDINENCLKHTETGLQCSNCNMKNSYACLRVCTGFEKTFYISETCYIFFFSLKNWTEAQNICRNYNGRLPELTSYQKKDDVLNLIVNYDKDILHFWLGGVNKDNVWVWYDTNETIDFENKYLTFFPLDTSDFNCLNIDKLKNEPLSIYGTRCDERQYFICEQSNVSRYACKKQEERRRIDFDNLRSYGLKR